MKNIFTLFLLTSILFAQAQYTTPGNGQSFTLSDLLLTEPAVVVLSGTNEYTLNADLTIAANDTLKIDNQTTLKITENVLVTVFGNFETYANDSDTENILVTAENPLQPYAGFRLEEGSKSMFYNTTFEYGGGFKVLSEDFFMNNCIVRYMSEGESTGAAISFSRGRPIIAQSHFLMNDLPAIASGANQSVAVRIMDNIFEKNGQLNENRPQINLSSSGTQDSITIVRNTVIGDITKEMVGGIAVANFYGSPNYVQIIDNEIYDNRYGIALYGSNEFALIKENIIRDNNTQNEPMQGGSGINLYSAGDEINTNVIVTGNTIERNLWGITLQGNAYANLGDGSTFSPGLNTFDGNGNNGILYALYNNTANDLWAMNNCWIAGEEATENEVENVIFHQIDESNLGYVDFSDFSCNLSINQILLDQKIQIYPNPTSNILFINSEYAGNAEIYDSHGTLVLRTNLHTGKNQINLNIETGIYFIKILANKSIYQQKLLIK